MQSVSLLKCVSVRAGGAHPMKVCSSGGLAWDTDCRCRAILMRRRRTAPLIFDADRRPQHLQERPDPSRVSRPGRAGHQIAVDADAVETG